MKIGPIFFFGSDIGSSLSISTTCRLPWGEE
jgi:hypothetical protein